MGVENFVDAPKTGNRTSKRARVLLAVQLCTEAGEIDGRLRDLSRKGALIECAKIPPVGSELTFKRGKTIVPARVAWAGGNRVGLEFAFLIDESELLVQLNSNASARHPQFDPAVFVDELTDQERKLARAWGASVGISLPED